MDTGGGGEGAGAEENTEGGGEGAGGTRGASGTALLAAACARIMAW